MIRPLEVKEEIAERIAAGARRKGVSVDDYLRDILDGVEAPGPSVALADDERRAANMRLRQHIVSLGYPTGIDNEQIDADLAREYSRTHDDER